MARPRSEAPARPRGEAFVLDAWLAHDGIWWLAALCAGISLCIAILDVLVIERGIAADKERLGRWCDSLTEREERMQATVTEISTKLSSDALNVYQEISRRMDRMAQVRRLITETPAVPNHSKEVVYVHQPEITVIPIRHSIGEHAAVAQPIEEEILVCGAAIID